MTTQYISIEDVPENGFHRLLTLRTGGGWILDGYVLSIIGIALVPLTADLNVNTFWQGMIAASALIGIFFGSIIAGWLGGRFGRQKLYFVAPTLFILCSIFQFWVESGEMLFWARFLIGIGVGFEYTVAGSLYTEFLPKESRASRISLLTVLWFFGAALAYVIGNIILGMGIEHAWRYVLASPAILGFLLFLIRLGTPESPRWLLSKGRIEEAELIIKKVYGSNFSIKNLPDQILEQKISLRNLVSSGYGTRLFFVSLTYVCSVAPVFAVYTFVPKVLDALHMTGERAVYGSILITILFWVGCVIATKLINNIGRRPMMIHSFLWSGLALVGLGAFSEGSQFLILACFGLYALFIGGASILQLVYPYELFPTQIRAAAVGIAVAFSRIGASIGIWLVPISMDVFGIGNTMYMMAGMTLVGWFVAIALAPETRGLSLADAATIAAKKS